MDAEEEEFSKKGPYVWGPDDLKNVPQFAKGGSIQLELECCEKENDMLGDVWVGSGIVENKTSRTLRNLTFLITLIGKDGITLPNVETEAIDVMRNEKVRVRFDLRGRKPTGGWIPIDFEDVKGIGKAGPHY